jgi:hypothetical protein
VVSNRTKEAEMNVVIGIDPHKASHTAVAIDEDEDELSSVRVRATRRQVEQLIGWAEPFDKRTWAIGVRRRDGASIGPAARSPR